MSETGWGGGVKAVSERRRPKGFSVEREEEEEEEDGAEWNSVGGRKQVKLANFSARKLDLVSVYKKENLRVRPTPHHRTTTTTTTT